jgi:hypothetical protein
MLVFLNTFIMDNSMRRDRQWKRAWRVVRPRPPDMSAFMTFNRKEVDRDRQTGETLCMMMSIIAQVMVDSSEDDTHIDTHEDEHRGIFTVISLTQEQLASIGSDKIPSFPWDPGVHFVSILLHFMMTQVVL